MHSRPDYALQSSVRTATPYRRFKWDTFFLDLLATDLRPNGMGVFASYADINYDSGKVLADGIVLLDSQNSGLDANTFLDGMIDEAGSFAGVTATGPAERRLVRFPFHATSVGQAVFQLEPADQSPVHDTFFYNSLGSVPLDQIEFQGSAVTVVPEPTTWSITSAALLLAVVVRAFGGVLDAQRRRLIHS